MKKIFKSLLLLMGAFLVFTPVIFIGCPASIVIFWVDNNKKIKDFILYLWGIYIGFIEALAYLLKSLAVSYDIIANALGGQSIEYAITKQRKTFLGSGSYTISAALGDLARRKALLPNGKRLNQLLNFVFNEENHSEYALRQEELIKNFSSSIPKQR